MPSLLEDHQPGLVVEVLYVEHCPNFPAALALVERVAAELGVDVEVRATMISDQAAAERARFVGSPTVRVDGRDVDPERAGRRVRPGVSPVGTLKSTR
jgi:hypothetical protein